MMFRPSLIMNKLFYCSQQVILLLPHQMQIKNYTNLVFDCNTDPFFQVFKKKNHSVGFTSIKEIVHFFTIAAPCH